MTSNDKGALVLLTPSISFEAGEGPEVHFYCSGKGLQIRILAIKSTYSALGWTISGLPRERSWKTASRLQWSGISKR